jgi:hypothetical protein
LFISLALSGIGALLAFDIGGFASRNHANNGGFTPWGRRMARSSTFKPHLLVGWIFLIAGVQLLILAAVALIVDGWP